VAFDIARVPAVLAWPVGADIIVSFGRSRTRLEAAGPQRVSVWRIWGVYLVSRASKWQR